MKYIYLDQNKWIELAKGLKNNDKEYIKLKEMICEKISVKEWAFPISIIHLAETMRRNDISSRNDVLNLMYDLSRGYAICDSGTSDDIEFKYWIENQSFDYHRVLEKIISNDYAKILGLSNEDALRKAISELNVPLDENKLQLSYEIMTQLKVHRSLFDRIANLSTEMCNDEEFYHNQYNKAKELFDKWRDYCKSLDEYKKKHEFPAYTLKMFFASYEQKICQLDEHERIKILQIFKNNEDPNFLETMPGFNIYNQLVFELFTNKNRKIHKHDFFDISFLRVAVPYCDIVICEKHWGSIISKLKLDQKYSTHISKNIFDLYDL